MFLMPVLTGELGTMGRCDATFFSTMQSLKKETHTHTHPRSRLAGIRHTGAVNTCESDNQGATAPGSHTYKYGHTSIVATSDSLRGPVRERAVQAPGVFALVGSQTVRKTESLSVCVALSLV